jgi:hypothetical protein
MRCRRTADFMGIPSIFSLVLYSAPPPSRTRLKPDASLNAGKGQEDITLSVTYGISECPSNNYFYLGV